MSTSNNLGNAGGRLGPFVVAALGGTALLHGALVVLGADFSLNPASYQLYLYLAGIAVPSVSAIVLTESGQRWAFVSTALRARGVSKYVLIAISAQAAIVLGAWGLFWVAGGVGAPEIRLGPAFTLLALGQVWVVLGEEFGWRGFALPRLVAAVGARSATLVLALLWGLWHTPMFFVAHSLQWRTSPWLFAAAIFAWSAIHTALYLRAQPSLLPNLVFHACANVTLSIGLTSHGLEPFLITSYVVLGLAAWVVGAARSGGRD